MKKHSIVFILLLLVICGRTQDYIITWNNDTIPCTMMDKPWKKGHRPEHQFYNGHFRTVAEYGADSTRVIEPGTIKGYYRAKHGRRYLCDGYFESRTIKSLSDIYSIPVKNDRSPAWFFMEPIVKGKYASLYRIYAQAYRTVRPIYLLSRHDQADSLLTAPTWTRKQTVELLADIDIKEELENYRKTGNKVRIWTIVKEYNRLKEKATASAAVIN